MAHVDGLLPVGPDRRRFAREYHAYILGVCLGDCNGAPTVFWPGSHRIVGRALREAIGESQPAKVDVTEAYHAARAEVFATCEMVTIKNELGASFLLHRHTLHGTDVWDPALADNCGPEGRMIAFFRPEFRDPADWLSAA